MPFDPSPLRELADQIADLEGDEEMKLRAAVGRTYYAVFLVAREKTSVVARENIHSQVVYQVKRRLSQIVGGKLDNLKQLREAADYEYPPADPSLQDWQANWRDARRLADQLLEKLANVRMKAF